MRTKVGTTLAALFGITLIGSGSFAIAGDATDSLKSGTPEIQSAGPLAFGPDGILFVGDTRGAALFAIATGETGKAEETKAVDVSDLQRKIAERLGTTARDIAVNDMAISPASGKVYLSVSRGQGPDAAPVILTVNSEGKIDEMSLKDVKFSKTFLPNPPSPDAKERGQSLRNESITDLAFADGRVFLAGLSNEEFSSRLLAIPFPFQDLSEGASIEIYHGAHGRFETRSPVRTFVAYEVGGKPHLLAAYTCTPLVKIPTSALKPGAHVKGTTIAELGNRNRPLDMVVYQQGGKDYLLLSNSSRGVMKIDLAGAEQAQSITAPVQGTKGQSYKTIETLKGVMQLDKLGENRAVVLTQDESGSMALKTIDLP